MEFVRTIFRRLFEDTTVTTNFLKSNICNTFRFGINTSFANFSNNELWNLKIRMNHIILKGMDDGSWKVFSSINATKLVTQN